MITHIPIQICIYNGGFDSQLKQNKHTTAYKITHLNTYYTNIHCQYNILIAHTITNTQCTHIKLSLPKTNLEH